MLYFLSCLFSLLLLSGSSVAQVSYASPPEQRDDGWTTATLEASGFDADRMLRLTEKLEAGGFPNTHIVVIEYDGKLVYEKYLSGQDQNWGHSIGHRQFNSQSLHDLRSVSKSVTSLLLGIALGDFFKARRNLVRILREILDDWA